MSKKPLARRRSPEVLEQAVNERSERRTLGKDQSQPDDEKDDDDRDQPPAFVLPEELEQFSDDPQLRKEILDRAHVALDPVSYFRIMKFSRTSTSMPLLLNVEYALAGVVTIGSPLKLKDVFKRTGTPVARPNLSTIL